MVPGTYAPGGVFHAALAAAPGSGKALLPAFGDAFSGSKMFVLVSMLSTAFIAHYNAPRYSTHAFFRCSGLHFALIPIYLIFLV
jgi:hypothetical protein